MSNLNEYHNPEDREAILQRTRDASPGVDDETMERLARLMSPQDEEQPMGEDGLDLGGPPEDLGGGLGDDGLGDELGGDSLGDELSDGGMVEVDGETLRQLLDDVEAGAKTADEAYDECCGGGGEEELGGLDDELGGDELESEGLGMGAVASECGGMYEGVDVNQIANMLTDDPDIFDL